MNLVFETGTVDPRGAPADSAAPEATAAGAVPAGAAADSVAPAAPPAAAATATAAGAAPAGRRLLRHQRWAGVTASLAAFGLLVSACGSSAATTSPTVTAPVVTPGGSASYTAAANATATADTCDAVASIPALSPLPPPGSMPAASWEATIERRGYLIAGVDQSTYLWAYRDPTTGQLSGFDIDMLHEISQAIFGNPDKIHFVVVPNANRVSAVQSGQVDIVAETMTITCEREQSVDFSTVYYQAGQRLLVPNGSAIKTDKDLGGKRVCATAGSTSLQNLANLDLSPPVREVAVTNQSDCLVMLQQHQVDAISTDDTILQGLAAQDPNVSLAGPAFTQEPYGMAISKKHPEFTAFVNAVLEQERTDGTWTAIYTKWLGRFAAGKIPAPPAAHVPDAVVSDGVATIEQIDARIAAVRSATERMGQHLFELDGDPMRQVLDSSPLSGASAAAWSGAPEQISGLWQAHLALTDLLEQAARLRGTKRKLSDDQRAALAQVLNGPAVTLAPAVGAGPSTPAFDPLPRPALTIDETLQQMGTTFSTLAHVVAQAGEVWSNVVPALGELDEELDAIEADAIAAGSRVPNDVAVARRQIRDLRDQAGSDPLSVGPDLVTTIAVGVQRARAATAAAARARSDLQVRMATVGAQLDQIAALLGAAASSASQQAVKITGAPPSDPDVDRAVAELAALRARLDAIAAEAGISWEDSDRRLTALGPQAATLLDRAGQLRRQSGTALATRNELRGRLDAYRAKAQATGRAEDIALESLYQEAHRTLFSAPCDLERAGDLVVRYQRAVTSPPPESLR